MHVGYGPSHQTTRNSPENHTVLKGVPSMAIFPVKIFMPQGLSNR